MKQDNLVAKMTSKFVVIVFPVIAFLIELSLANFTYSKYAQQQVGTKTLIANISTESKIACGIACKTTENCVGFWHNHTVFENHRKRLIQHGERSELRLHFEWTKVHKK